MNATRWTAKVPPLAIVMCTLLSLDWAVAEAQQVQIELRQSVDIEAERLLTRDLNCVTSTGFTCRDRRLYTFGWEPRWPAESACPTFELSKRVALEWQIGPDVIPPGSVILNVDVEFDIRIPAEYSVNAFEIHGHPNRLPQLNEWESGGDSPCASIWDRVQKSPIYTTEQFWHIQGKKLVNLGDRARQDLQTRVLSPSTFDDYFTIGLRSTQEGSFPPGGPFCVIITQGQSTTVDCSDFVQLFGPQTLIVTYAGVGSARAPGLLAPVRMTAKPNPFRSATTVEYSLPASGDVTLAVFDVTGARVRTLIDAPVTAGTHHVVWDGRDHSGRRVGSGVYFYRLQSLSSTTTGKVFMQPLE